MRLGNRNIDATLRLVDRFTGPMGKAIERMEHSQKTFKRMGNQIAREGRQIQRTGSNLAKSITLPVAGLGVTAIKTAADFETGMSKVQSISGASADDMDLLSKKAQEMGAKTKFSASESADAFSYMAMAGWKTDDMLKGIEGTMYLAGATGEDLASVSDIVTDSLTAFGLKAKDTDKFVNILAQTASNSNTNVAMLGESFKYAAPAAGALGYNVKDTTLALGLMANSGIKASSAGTSLRSWFTRMAKPTKESSTAMKALGISMTDANGKMKPFNQVMQETRKSFSGLTESQKAQYAAMLAGKTGMSGLLAIVNSSDKDFNKLAKAINNSNGAAKKMYDVANDNLNGRLTVLKSTIESVAISFGEKLMPYAEKGAKKLQQLAEKFNNLSGKQQDMIIKIALVAAAAGPALMILGKTMTGVGGAIKLFGKFGGTLAKFGTNVGKAKAIFGGAGSIISKAGGALKLFITPAGATLAIIAALVVGGVLLYKNWDKVQATASKLGKHIKKTFNAMGGDSNKVVKSFKSMKKSVGQIIDNLKPVFTKLDSSFRPIAKFFAKFLVIDIKTGLNLAVGIISASFKSITEIIGGLLKSFKGITQFLNGVFTGDWKKAWDGLKTYFSGWGQAVVGLVKTPINAIIGLINGATSSINKFLQVKIPSWVPKLGGKEFKMNIRPIPMLYKGTNFWQGGPAMVHDKGAEIIDLPRGSRVIPHDKSLVEARKSASKNIKVEIKKICETIVVRKDSDIDAIADAFAKKLEEVAYNM